MYVERDYAVVVPSGLKAWIYWGIGWVSEGEEDLLHRIKACCSLMERC